MLVDQQFFSQIFNFIGSSVIYLSLSEIPIWTHQSQFGLSKQESVRAAKTANPLGVNQRSHQSSKF